MIAAHRHEDETEPAHGIGRRFWRAQSRRESSHPASGNASVAPMPRRNVRRGDELFRDDHSDFLMVNGVLLTMPTMIDEKR